MSLNETEVQWNLRLPLWIKQAFEIHAVKQNIAIKEVMKDSAKIFHLIDAENIEQKHNWYVGHIKNDWMKDFKEEGFSETQTEELMKLYIQQIKQHYPHLLQELESHVS